jgi:Na+/serine symporter
MTAPRPPLTLSKSPSAVERADARRRLAWGAVMLLAAAAAVALTVARDESTVRMMGLSVGAGVVVVAFVALAYGAMLGIVVVLEPLSRRGRVAGYALESALHALLPFLLVTLVVALVTGLPEGGALHLRAMPVLTLFGALVGLLRWVIAERGHLR